MEPLTELDVLKDLASGGTIARSRSRNWRNEASGDSGWSGTTEIGEQASVAAKPSTEPLVVRTSNARPPSSASRPLSARGSAASGYPPPRNHHRQSADSPLAFYTSFVVAVLLPALFLVFNADWLWHTNEGGTRWGKALVVVVAVGAVVVWVLMLITALSNPGIIPRNLDPDPPRHWIPLDPSASSADAKEGEGEGEWRVEMRYVKVLGGNAVVGCKWCETCKTYRPPRTSHCRLCDNCVERTDHHCAFLNTCIGRRNYLPFFLFLLSTALLASLSIALSAVHVAFGGPQWDWQRIGAFVVMVLTAVRTTIEMLRPPLIRFALLDPSTHLPFSTTPSADGIASTTNPWTTGNAVKNCVEVVCFPGRERVRVEGK
ncbi:Eukaryotic peptide chain release factor GTP-binding subunit [Rhodotorula toruloides]